jgi:hypothetical protein
VKRSGVIMKYGSWRHDVGFYYNDLAQLVMTKENQSDLREIEVEGLSGWYLYKSGHEDIAVVNNEKRMYVGPYPTRDAAITAAVDMCLNARNHREAFSYARRALAGITQAKNELAHSAKKTTKKSSKKSTKGVKAGGKKTSKVPKKVGERGTR